MMHVLNLILVVGFDLHGVLFVRPETGSIACGKALSLESISHLTGGKQVGNALHHQPSHGV